MIPDYQTIMLPLLKKLNNGQVYKFREIVDSLSLEFSLTEEEKRELLPSGSQAIFDNRVGWARFYLKKAGLLISEKRGMMQISERGKELIEKGINELKTKDLEQFKEFIEFKESMNKESKKTSAEEPSNDTSTPIENLEYAYQKLRKDLASELLDVVKSSSPAFFEQLVVDLLINMGYGGSRREAGRALGRSGDGGIDGIIKEDMLGLDAIYLQAKKWENSVPVKEIRDFAGALLANKARKGIFIATSSFPPSAYDFVNSIEHKIILIDGEMLTELMIEHNVGVSVESKYEVKKIDSDYFEE